MLTLLKHEVNNQDFIFEAIRWWPVINLVTVIHGYSYLVLLEFVVVFKKLRRFQGTQVNLSVLLEKPGIKYGGTLNTESLEPSCRISPKT